MRMTGYVVSVAKPSGTGLKLDLNRCRRDIEELIRKMKKDADSFVSEAKLELAATGHGGGRGVSLGRGGEDA